MFQEELDQQKQLHGVAMSCNVLHVHCTYCTYAACRPVWLAELGASAMLQMLHRCLTVLQTRRPCQKGR